MNRFRRRLVLGAATAALAPVGAVRAQRAPIRFLIGLPPGGATDAVARSIIDRLPSELGQPVIVENKPGVGGRFAADALLLAAPDGLTYMVAPDATVTFQTLLFKDKLKWNFLKDFASVATLASYPMGMAVAANTGARDVRSFLDWLRRHPDKGNLGVPGLGGRAHFLGYQFGQLGGLPLNVVPYKGTPPMLTDLVGGQLTSAVGLMDGVLPHHRSGSANVIGMFTPKRSALVPDIPTMAEQGVDVTRGESWAGMWAPAHTPLAEIERMQAALKKVLGQPDLHDTMTKRLYATPHFRPGQEMTDVLVAELAYWEPIIRASGFKAE